MEYQAERQRNQDESHQEPARITKKLKVLCVRTGDKFSNDYVIKLRNMVARHLSLPHEFVCLSDGPPIVGVKMKPAEFEGWWAKVSLFKETRTPCLYFDLDTVIVGGIDQLAEAVMDADDPLLLMLRRFDPKKVGWMSGVMAWRGDWSFISRDYDHKTHSVRFPGDQDYITEALLNNREKGVVLSVQSVLPGVYSYKRDVMRQGLPENARVVCFHGRPKVTQVRDKWLIDNWR